jgi:hypothetical protein
MVTTDKESEDAAVHFFKRAEIDDSGMDFHAFCDYIVSKDLNSAYNPTMRT